MKRVSPKIHSLLVVICVCSFSLITTQATPVANFSEAELDEIFAPIALYPDPLLAQIVPAATYIDQLQAAQQTLKGSTDDELIGSQSWDVSVKSVAHYPEVLNMMVSKPDWTTAIGQAYVNQKNDVSKSIQRLRAEANAAGNLTSTPQQTVDVSGDVIKITPAEPQVIYVPQYNPQTVYEAPSTGAVVAARAISFTAGLAMGAWLNNDWDYYGRGVYYHGWNGGGWVGASRSYVNVNRNVYVNNSFSNVNLNRAVTNRNISSSYRGELTRNSVARQNNLNNYNRNRANPNNAPRSNAGRNNVNRNDVNAGGNDRGGKNNNLGRDNTGRTNADRNNAGRNDSGRNPSTTRDANRANTTARGGARTENSPTASRVGANSGGHRTATGGHRTATTGGHRTANTGGHKTATTGTHNRTSGSTGHNRTTKSGGAAKPAASGGNGRKRP